LSRKALTDSNAPQLSANSAKNTGGKGAGVPIECVRNYIFPVSEGREVKTRSCSFGVRKPCFRFVEGSSLARRGRGGAANRCEAPTLRSTAVQSLLECGSPCFRSVEGRGLLRVARFESSNLRKSIRHHRTSLELPTRTKRGFVWRQSGSMASALQQATEKRLS